MDGVEQLNNILVIGMTNRKDMIDEALLRSGLIFFFFFLFFFFSFLK